jgi:hypothetical protein
MIRVSTDAIEFSKPYLRESLELTEQLDNYKLLIPTQDLHLKLVYNEKYAQPTGTAGGDDVFNFMHYLKLYKNEFSTVKIMNNNGDNIFEGVLDEDSEIKIADNSMEIKFLGKIAAKLDTELNGTVYAPVNTEIGEAVQTYIEGFFAKFLPEYKLQNADVVSSFLEEKINDLNSVWNYAYMFYNVTYSNSTILEGLKDICTLGFCRIIFLNNNVYFVSQNNNETVVPDGRLLYDGSDEPITKTLEKQEFVGNVRLYARFLEDDPGGGGASWVTHSFDTNTLQVKLNYYYIENAQKRVKTHYFYGLNSNLQPAMRFDYNGKSLLITKLKRDLGMIDRSLQYVEIEAEETA